MALNIFLNLKGQRQGQISGSVIQKGREGQIEVIAVDHDIISLRDPASGLPTGKRMHKPIVITKEIDKSTPLLHSAMTTNENLTTFVLNLYEPNVQGVEKNYYRIELVNANIVEIHTRVDNIRRPESLKLAPYEEVAFTYQKITWTYVDGGITSTDDWMAAQV